jgi:hypothetical protein
MTTTQAIKQLMRVRYPDYYASPTRGPPTSASAATPGPEGLPEIRAHPSMSPAA